MASDRDLAQRAVRAGAAAAQRMAGGELDVRRKTSAADLVSAADHASEEAIVALLRAERPDDAIVGEEGASVGAGSRRWLVDGLDGTVNFLRAIPQWCVAVVLEQEGEP
ncbi:MAG: inositol monophosphatase family protein, partial [Solirubrobacteraceae bacterium]